MSTYKYTRPVDSVRLNQFLEFGVLSQIFPTICYSLNRAQFREASLSPVLDQHEFTGTLILLREEQPVAIVRNRHSTDPARRRLFQREDWPSLVRLQVRKSAVGSLQVDLRPANRCD